MLRIYQREGKYCVPFHEFAKSVILGDRRYYKEMHSKIMNIFNCGTEKNSSHFTGLRVLSFLNKRKSEFSYQGEGYVEIIILINLFEEIFDNREDFIKTCNRLLKWNLIEVNTRSTESISGASYLRITASGTYYLQYLVNSFCYLDLVLQDTLINDESILKELVDLMREVDNLTGKDDEKTSRTAVRFSRVDLFLSYLSSEEESEFKQNKRIKECTEFKESYLIRIKEYYEKEKSFILKRINENAEKHSKELEESEEIESEQVYEEESSYSILPTH